VLMVRNFLEALRGTNPGGSEWPAQHGFQVFVMKTAGLWEFPSGVREGPESEDLVNN
jgi:hypothetical protein